MAVMSIGNETVGEWLDENVTANKPTHHNETFELMVKILSASSPLPYLYLHFKDYDKSYSF